MIDLAIGERAEGPVFVTADGRRLDRRGAGRIVRRIARRAGITKPAGPHTLRHVFFTAALDAGVPLRDAQEAASMRIRVPRCAMTGPAPRWTGTPLISSPPSSPEQPDRPPAGWHGPPGPTPARRTVTGTTDGDVSSYARAADLLAGQRVSVTVRTAPLRDVRRGRRSGAAGCDAEGGYERPDDGRGRGEPVFAGEFMSAAAGSGEVRLTEVVLHRAADRDRDGHPQLTDAVKERGLGVHAAELFGLDPDATRCGLPADMPAVSRARAA